MLSSLLCKRLIFEHRFVSNSHSSLVKSASLSLYSTNPKFYSSWHGKISTGSSPKSPSRHEKSIKTQSLLKNLASPTNPSEETSRNLKRVQSLLKEHGFNDAHIKKVISLVPKIVSADPDEFLLPKLAFVRSIGITESDLPEVICKNVDLLRGNLENKILPTYEFFKRNQISDEGIAKILRRNPWNFNLTKRIAPNVELLAKLGVPEDSIVYFVREFRAASSPHERFKESVEKAIEMGFDIYSRAFVKALHILYAIQKSLWDDKVKLYKKYGITDEDFLLAFKYDPFFMAVSEDKISRAMDFLVKEMKWAPSIISRCPTVITCSLEKRVVPRCKVIDILMKKGLKKKSLGLTYFLKLPEEKFLDNFVRKYVDVVPDLMDVYLGKKGLVESESDSSSESS